jgi:magnesium chelatase family protein
MLARIFAGTVEGVDGILVEVEVDIANGLPTFATVGLPETSVRESKDRVKAAILNSGYKFPNRRITVNLAPADLRKAGTAFDLPIAVALLAASEMFKSDILENYLLVGELSLDGSVRPVNGILPLVILAKKRGFRGVILAKDNALEGSVVDGIDIIGVDTLYQAVEFLAGIKQIAAVKCNLAEILASQSHNDEGDFSEVKGQENLKRAMEIAAAGGHNVLMSGVPGSGKTMVARRLPSILPDMTFDESLEVTKVYSVSGLLRENKKGLITKRPFRAPHHTISDAGLIGGGQYPKPGEVSLSHNGVLFLDELAEFRRNVLEGLRQPLEDGDVTISRASTSLSFPARFILIAAMNPCPCGYFGDTFHECSCSASQIQRYTNKISGPLIDRFDIHLDVHAVPYKELVDSDAGESSREVKERVVRARNIQVERFKRCRNIHCNNQMSSRHIQKYCSLDKNSHLLLETAMTKLGLSARAFNRIRKIARTIADLAGNDDILSSHIAEAIQYRRQKKKN